MTPEQLDLIPSALLRPGATERLLRYLSDRRQRLTLLDLEQERARRGFRPAPTNPTKGKP